MWDLSDWSIEVEKWCFKVTAREDAIYVVNIIEIGGKCDNFPKSHFGEFYCLQECRN